MKRLALILSLAMAGLGQPMLSPPHIGFVQGGDHSFRPVHGIAGCFVLGDAAAHEVVRAAFSGSFGLVQTPDVVAVFDAQGQAVAAIEASSGPALFAFAPDGAPVLVYLRGSGAFLQWTGGTFQPAALGGGESVVAIAAAAGEAELLVEREDSLWDLRFRIATGELIAQTALPGVAAPALLLASGDLVYTAAGALVVRRADGSEKILTMPLPARFELQQMGAGWVQLRDLETDRHFAIRLERDREAVYELPEAGR